MTCDMCGAGWGDDHRQGCPLARPEPVAALPPPNYSLMGSIQKGSKDKPPMTDQTPRTEAGRRLLGFDLGPPEAYWVNLSANEMRTAILAIEAQARAEALDESRCWFCKRMVPVDALIAGYATFDEQRLACMACNEVMQARIEALDLDALASPSSQGRRTMSDQGYALRLLLTLLALIGAVIVAVGLWAFCVFVFTAF
jgi:hypothetical protein